ncbi:DMT family transporter [Bacillus cereus group sp. MYBK79-1]|uniref:DMT family transporter n=1 Tax=unclassified Bacillus cereus group TaxID=2750818 RepID=UPI003F78E92E
MRSLSSLIVSTICSIILILWNALSFYEKFTKGNSYYWLSGILGLVFVFFFIQNIRDILNKNYKTS